jgi:hypothetical protein
MRYILTNNGRRYGRENLPGAARVEVPSGTHAGTRLKLFRAYPEL